MKAQLSDKWHQLNKYLKKEKTKDLGAALFLLAPFLIVTSAFMLYPIFFSLKISFMDFSFLNPNAATWVGLDNYKGLLNDQTFLTSMKNTIKLVLIVVPLQTIISLILANVLYSKLRFKTFFRTVYFMPYVTSAVVRPTTFMVLVMGVLATLQVFEQPYVVSTTGEALPGSPGDSTLTMVMFLYTQAFRYYNMVYASAAAFIIFILVFDHIVPGPYQIQECS